MSRCEDFPCCGHELGCCPDFDEVGRQLNMKCTCGAVVPLSSRFSICEGCMDRALDEDGYRDDDRGYAGSRMGLDEEDSHAQA